MQLNKTRRLALSALLVALMLILGYLESLIPVGTIPGIKLGLSNSVLLLAIYWLGIPLSFCLMVVKVVLSGLLFSGVNAMMYSFAGGFLSMIVMSALYKAGGFSPVVTGIAGSVFHNVGQVGLAIIILKTNKLVYYMAILMFIGIITGFATGTIAKLLMNRLPENLRPDHRKDS